MATAVTIMTCSSPRCHRMREDSSAQFTLIRHGVRSGKLAEELADRFERLGDIHEMARRAIRCSAHSARRARVGNHGDQQMVTLNLGAHYAIPCLRLIAHRNITTQLPYDAVVTTIPIVRHGRVSANA